MNAGHETQGQCPLCGGIGQPVANGVIRCTDGCGSFPCEKTRVPDESGQYPVAPVSTIRVHSVG